MIRAMSATAMTGTPGKTGALRLIMPEIRTKRWNDPIEPKLDGTRILVCRYRPRGLPKSEETWSEWYPNLGPSKELHAAVYGKNGAQPLDWTSYRAAYLREMRDQKDAIASLATRVAKG